MKRLYWIIFTLCLCFGNEIVAQISYGGTPLFLVNSALRSSYSLDYFDMPAFDVDSVKRIDELNNENMRGSFPFAYKFYTHIEKGKEGTIQVLADGTKVWQVGIRSKDAYSINLLFTKFHLPEGGKLFIYNVDHSYVIGSFDYRNNSSDRILPVQPVAGDEIIIEYSEPANAAFEGELVIGEVNHDYRNFLAAGSGEPKTDVESQYGCMQDVLCSDADKKLIRSTILLIINGQFACTGTLVNNTANDEKPYLLTAVHCLNDDLQRGVSKDNPFYVTRAGTVIAFFNYDRYFCGTVIKAAETMSLAKATPRLILEKKDVALLEFQEKPPLCYHVYYAGWNMEGANNQSPYSNLHHPNAAVKKYGVFRNNLQLTIYPGKLSNNEYVFDSDSHWEVPMWSAGSTHPGSSGSPLFDKSALIVGTLSGGWSICNGNNPGLATDAQGKGDFFTALYKSWDQDSDPNNQLKTYLDPAKTGKKRQDGFDPHAANPFMRKGNADYNHGDNLTWCKYDAPNTGFVFGNSNLNNVTEFAEEYNLEKSSEIWGVYLTVPTMPFSSTSGVEIEIYDGTNAPQTLLAKQAFNPRYRYYSGGAFNEENISMNEVATDHFVAFSQPVQVKKKFFVAYKINFDSKAEFTVLNTEFASSAKANTAWIKDGQNWIKSSEYAVKPVKTSLALQPLLRYTNDNIVYPIDNVSKSLYYDRATGQLHLTFEPNSAGKIWIYSISGQLKEMISFSKGETTFLLSFPKEESIGIVKMLYDEGVYSKKIVY